MVFEGVPMLRAKIKRLEDEVEILRKGKQVNDLNKIAFENMKEQKREGKIMNDILWKQKEMELQRIKEENKKLKKRIERMEENRTFLVTENSKMRSELKALKQSDKESE